MQQVLLQAFMCRRIFARNSFGAASMKLTVSLRGIGPQYFVVSTAIRIGSVMAKAAPAPTGAIIGAFIGLTCRACWAALTRSRFGKGLIEHDGTSEDGPSSSGSSAGLFDTDPASSAIVARVSRSRSRSLMVRLSLGLARSWRDVSQIGDGARGPRTCYTSFDFHGGGFGH